MLRIIYPEGKRQMDYIRVNGRYLDKAKFERISRPDSTPLKDGYSFGMAERRTLDQWGLSLLRMSSTKGKLGWGEHRF